MANMRTASRQPIGIAIIALSLLYPAHSAPGQEPPVHVLFTVDVESMNEGNPQRDIWGALPGSDERHGIERMMNTFDRHGVKGTFFVNVYEAAKHGTDALAKVCRAISDRGHDVELHTHPDPVFGVYGMRDASLAKQTEILRYGAELIERWTGQKVVAHRAGGYLGNYDTLTACRALGIMSEYSHNWGYHGEGFAEPGLTVNKAVVRDDVLCVPVTNYIQAKVGGWESLRFLDVEASSPQEIRKVVADLHEHDVRTAVIMMHSFSFVRGGKVNTRAEGVLDELLADFVADADVKVVTASQLYDIWRSDPGRLAGGDYLPTTGLWMTYCRAWQRLDEGWKNLVFAFTPPVLCLVGIIVAGLYWRCRRRKLPGLSAS